MDEKRMITFWKKAAAMVLVFAVMLLLPACGRDKGSDKSDNQAKQGVFREKDKAQQFSGIITDSSNIAVIACFDEILYIAVDTYPEGGHTVVLHTWDKEGNKLSEAAVFEAMSGQTGTDDGIMPLNGTGENEPGEASPVIINAYDFRITPQGYVLYTLNEMKMDENGDIAGNTDKSYLKCVDKTGNQLFLLDTKSLTEGEEETAVQSVVFSPDNTLYLLTGQKVFEVDMAGNIVNKYNLPEGYTELYNPAFYYKGEPVFTVWNYEGETSTVKSLIFDFKSGSVKKELDIPQNILSQYSIYSGTVNGYDLILGNSTGIYGYRMGREEPELVMNYLASDLPVNGFDNLCFLSGTEFVCSYYNIVEDKSQITWIPNIKF